MENFDHLLPRCTVPFSLWPWPGIETDSDDHFLKVTFQPMAAKQVNGEMKQGDRL
jgi:hypothetical protein